MRSPLRAGHGRCRAGLTNVRPRYHATVTERQRGTPQQIQPADFRNGSMLSKKYQTASRLISRRKTNHAMIVRRYAPRLVTKVTGEFIALRCLPPHIYKIAAPTARRICVQLCKKTFSTASVKTGSIAASALFPHYPQSRHRRSRPRRPGQLVWAKQTSGWRQLLGSGEDR
jgi:hypothetical protein